MQGDTPKKLIEQAYKDFSDEIFRFTLYRVRNRETALDIVQDVFVKTMKYLENGKEIDNMRPFLYKTARNCIIDHIRTKHSTPMWTDADDGTWGEDEGFVDDVSQKYDSKLLSDLMDRLQDDEREILQMRYLAELPLDEIAAAWGKTSNHISVMIHRAEKKLQKIYDEL